MHSPALIQRLPAFSADQYKLMSDSGVAAKTCLMQTPAAIRDVSIRVERNHFQHRQLAISDLFHHGRNTGERNISAPYGVVLVALPGRIGKMNQADAVADPA
jgi:hypothetical protein